MNVGRSGSDEAERAAGPPAHACRLRGLAAVLCGLAVLAASTAWGVLPAFLGPWLAGPAVLATLTTLALGPLVRWTPGPADPWKLAAFTLVLSPVLAAAIFGLARWCLQAVHADPAIAHGFTALAAACLHLLLLGRSVRAPGAPRGALAALLLGLLLSAAVGFLLLRGNEPRLVFPGIERAGVAAALERSLPPEHPWLAGEAWDRVWSGDLLALSTAKSLHLAPTRAHALLSVLAALLTPAFLFLLASSLWRDARRAVAGLLLALCAACLPLASGAPAWSVLALFLEPGPSNLALVLSLAGLFAASHALRRGERPWVGLCGLSHGLALVLDLTSAWPAALSTALATCSPACPARVRPRVLLALVLAALPSLVQARLLEPALAASGALDPASVALGTWPWLLLALVSALRAVPAVEPERRVVLHLSLAAAVSGLAAASYGGPWTAVEPASALGLFACGWLAPGPLGAVFTGFSSEASLSRAARRFGIAWLAACAGLGSFGPWVLRGEWTAARAAAGRDEPLCAERAQGLEPGGSDAAAKDLREALAFLRTEPQLAEDRAVLLACPVHNPYRTTRDLPQLALAAATPLALYGDSRGVVNERHPAFLPRLEELLLLFRREQDLDPTLFPRLERLGARAAVLLLREEDVAFVPGVVAKLELLGFARWRGFGTVALYLGPRAAHGRYGISAAK